MFVSLYCNICKTKVEWGCPLYFNDPLTSVDSRHYGRKEVSIYPDYRYIHHEKTAWLWQGYWNSSWVGCMRKYIIISEFVMTRDYCTHLQNISVMLLSWMLYITKLLFGFIRFMPQFHHWYSNIVIMYMLSLHIA